MTFVKFCLLLLFPLILTSCSSKFQEKIGIKQGAPDASVINKYQPLAIPPIYSLPEFTGNK